MVLEAPDPSLPLILESHAQDSHVRARLLAFWLTGDWAEALHDGAADDHHARVKISFRSSFRCLSHFAYVTIDNRSNIWSMGDRRLGRCAVAPGVQPQQKICVAKTLCSVSAYLDKADRAA
jgi:hypothetical protein